MVKDLQGLKTIAVILHFQFMLTAVYAKPYYFY